MIDWLTQTIHGWGLTWGQVLFGVLFSVVTFVLSILVVTVVLVKLPANYFHPSHAREFLVERHPVLRALGIFAKNLAGLVLVFFGVLMSLPGVPGQGVLTILLGVMLLDFPGKRALETYIVSRPRVRAGVNALRARFDKPPLMLDEVK
jgi:archaellum biogenesis protein FlaJ (TadC family)